VVARYRNSAPLDQGLEKITIDILGRFMPGFTGEIPKRLPLDVRDCNDRNGQAEADAYAQAEH
jgi:hypothetical protein